MRGKSRCTAANASRAFWRIAYLTDTVGLLHATLAWLLREPLDVLVLDCSMSPQLQAPRIHNDLTLALKGIEKTGLQLAVLAHVGHMLDTWLLQHRRELPRHVSVGRDEQVV